MGSFSIWHWLIVFIVVALVFGTNKLRNMGSDLGAAVKGFKEGMKEEQTPDVGVHAAPLAQSVLDNTSEVQVKETPH